MGLERGNPFSQPCESCVYVTLGSRYVISELETKGQRTKEGTCGVYDLITLDQSSFDLAMTGYTVCVFRRLLGEKNKV